MSTNDTSYGVAATSERELTDNAIDTFFRALLRPAALPSDGLIEPQRGLTGAAGRNEAHPLALPAGLSGVRIRPPRPISDRSIMRLMERSLKAPERPHQRRSERQHESRRQER